MVAQDSPVLEACDGVLDASAPLAVPPPGGIPHDAASAKPWRHELVDATVSAVGEDPPVLSTQDLDRGAAVMNGVVAVSWSAARDRDDAAIVVRDQDLDVARPTVVLGRCRHRVIARRDERTVEDPGPAEVSGRSAW